MSEQYDPQKYDAVAGRFSEHTYADPGRYFARRLRLMRTLGPRVDSPARVLELACGDGAFGALLIEAGYEYAGIDASPGMVAAAAARLGPHVHEGDFRTYAPAEQVDVTVCWNAFYYATDRVGVLERIRSYTRVKFVFDFIPREHAREAVVADLRAAGFSETALRPFFVPQSYTLPRPLQSALEVAEHVPPLATAILRRRFAYLAAAW